MLKISLLVPVYNVQRYLEQCLHSIVAQTLNDIEVICINDGSTDGSDQILQKFAERDRRIRVIDKSNSGYGASLNLGLQAAQGEYIAILESDDWMEADTLTSLYTHAINNDADVVRANYWHYWSKPKEKNVLQRVVPEINIGHAISPANHSELFAITPSIWAGLYRREMLEEASIKFLETPGASYQDSSFAFKVWCSAKKVVLLRAAFVHYRQDNEGSSVHSPAKVFCVVDEMNECHRFLKECRPDLLEALTPVLVKLKLLTYLWNLDRLAPDKRPGFLEVAQKELLADMEHGRFENADLQPWHQAELQTLLTDPKWFLTLRSTRGKTMSSRARYYFELGGLQLMLKAGFAALAGKQ